MIFNLTLYTGNVTEFRSDEQIEADLQEKKPEGLLPFRGAAYCPFRKLPRRSSLLMLKVSFFVIARKA